MQTAMQVNPHLIIFNILSIIGYKGDKDLFSKRFVRLILDQALLSVVDGLPADIKIRMKSEMTGVQDLEQAATVLTRYMNIQKYTSAVRKTTNRLLKDYLSTVIPKLNPQQKNRLDAYLRRLGSGI